jgi:aspartate aminotransferase
MPCTTWGTKVIEYSHSAGILSYREKMCSYYKKHGIEVHPEEIIVTAGASEAILFAVQTCLNPGDEIIIPEPFYANYNGFAISAGVKVKPIISSIETGFALPPISEFEKAIGPKDQGHYGV